MDRKYRYEHLSEWNKPQFRQHVVVLSGSSSLILMKRSIPMMTIFPRVMNTLRKMQPWVLKLLWID